MSQAINDPERKTARAARFSPFDALDYRIMQALHGNARASASEISRAVGANERTVRKRIDRLLDMGVGRLTLVVDPRAFGYGLSVDILMRIDPAAEERIVTRLLEMPPISYLAYGQDSTELSIEARFKTSDELHEFLRHTLPGIPGLEVTNHALVPSIRRNIDEWLPPPESFGLEH